LNFCVKFIVQTIADAWSLYGRGEFRGAADLSRKLLEISSEDASAIACLSVSLWELGGDAATSITGLRRAVTLAPGDGWLRHNFATVLASVGQFDEACDNYRKAIELKPEDTQAFYGLCQNRKSTEEDALVKQMLALYAGGTLSQRQQEYVCFGLAKVYADLGLHERAMHFCIEGNWIARRGYDAAHARADLAELRQMVEAGAFARLKPAAASKAPAPIFIVGMPRSGTTLVDTILSRHPEIHAGGEMPHVPEVETALRNWTTQQGYGGGPCRMLERIPTDYFTRNAAAVVGRVQKAAGDRSFSMFTDKLPDNAFRLGLISLLFPRARILYIRRHPLDCCISNLFLRFQHGNGYAFSQTLLGERYRQTGETMKLWKSALTLPILEVSYEALVSDPEPAIRRIIGFLGLEWNEACLLPHEAQLSAGRANQWQVRQPINTGSIGRWHRYEDWVQPLIAALGGIDAIEREVQELEAIGL
jgi:tetratricopeptide (TPR) repeat protein